MVTIREGNLLTSDCEVICHQTNCQGAMGSGIARAIRAAYPEAYQALRDRFCRGEAAVGEVDFVRTMRDGVPRCVVNCYGEYDYLPRGVVHTDYDGLRRCFKKSSMNSMAKKLPSDSRIELAAVSLEAIGRLFLKSSKKSSQATNGGSNYGV